MKRLWTAFILVVVISFAVLGWSGLKIYQEKPPIPESVVTSEGVTVVTGGSIEAGQRIWRGMGGMELGSIWGHGSYVAPDWTADWLHRECTFILDQWAQAQAGVDYTALPGEQQAALRERLKLRMRTNTYDPSTGRITLDPIRAQAFENNVAY